MNNFALFALIGFVLAELRDIYKERSALLEESQDARDSLRYDCQYYRDCSIIATQQHDDLRKMLFESRPGAEEAEFTDTEE